MSQDPNKIKALITFREKIVKKINELDSELKDTQALLETVNSILLEKGFKHPTVPKETASPEPLPQKEGSVEPEQPPPEIMVHQTSENVVPLKTVTGEMLALLHVTENSLRVLPAEDKNFTVNTPPFTHFLIERVLGKMQERDAELARNGQIPPDSIFSYTLTKEGDVIREITIKNVDAERVRELKSSIRWTLEKMFEKTKAQS